MADDRRASNGSSASAGNPEIRGRRADRSQPPCRSGCWLLVAGATDPIPSYQRPATARSPNGRVRDAAAVRIVLGRARPPRRAVLIAERQEALAVFADGARPDLAFRTDLGADDVDLLVGEEVVVVGRDEHRRSDRHANQTSGRRDLEV